MLGFGRRRQWASRGCSARSLLGLVALLAWGIGSTGCARLELSATTVRGGGSFDVTVIAPEWSQDPTAIGALRARVICDKVNEPAHDVDLLETGAASGVFVGRVNTVNSARAALPLPGLINVVAGTRIQVTYPGTALEATIRVQFPGFLLVPTSVAVGEDLQVLLQDPDVNLDSKVKDTVAVTVAVSCPRSESLACPSEAQDRLPQVVETLFLTETRPDSGTFTAALSTFLQKGSSAPHASAGDGAIDLRGASSKCGADQVTVTYSDSAPVAIQSAVCRASFRATLILSHSHIAAESNQTVNVTVADGDLLNRSSIQVVVFSSKTDEPPETILLTSTGSCTSVPTFTGAFYTHGGLARAREGDETMLVRPNDLLTVSYFDEEPGAAARKHIRVLTNATISTGPLRAGKSALLGSTTTATLELGSNLTVTVNDNDRDLDPYLADLIAGVRIAVSDNSSSSSLTLFETGSSTGFFTASYPIMGASCTSPHNSQCLEASQGAIVHVEYEDLTVDGGLETRTATLQVASEGTIMATTPDGGSTLSITVVDSDMDQLRHTSEQVVVIASSSAGDSRVVKLDETSSSSGSFTGVLLTSITPHLSKLLVSESTAAVNTAIELSYSDAVPRSNVVSRLTMCSTSELTLNPPYFIPGSAKLSITLIDADLQVDVLAIEKVMVSVISQTETDTIELVETGWATSIFTGDLATSTQATVAADGAIRVLSCCETRDTVTIQYIESCWAGMGSRINNSTASKAAKPGVLQATPILVSPGDNITIVVTDASLNIDPASSETYESLVVVTANGQSLSVTVIEDAQASGIFVGTVATSAVNATGKLLLPDISGVESSPILVEFTDVIPGFTQATVLETRRKGSVMLKQQNVDAGVLAIGNQVQAEVFDKDLQSSES